MDELAEGLMAVSDPRRMTIALYWHAKPPAGIAVLGYVLAFGDAVDNLPNIVQNIARVRDIVERVRLG
jgi:hypothetical protein